MIGMSDVLMPLASAQVYSNAMSILLVPAEQTQSEINRIFRVLRDCAGQTQFDGSMAWGCVCDADARLCVKVDFKHVILEMTVCFQLVDNRQEVRLVFSGRPDLAIVLANERKSTPLYSVGVFEPAPSARIAEAGSGQPGTKKGDRRKKRR